MPILYTYTAPKGRELSDEEIARGVNPPFPAHHPGVPLRDLTADDIEGMPAWLQDTVAASDLYEATPEGKKHYNAAVKAREPEPPPTTEPRRAASKSEKET